MYWVVMRRMGRSDGSFLTGHMWLIRVGPHRAPDTLKMTTAPKEFFYVIPVFIRQGRERRDQRPRGDERQKSTFGSKVI